MKPVFERLGFINTVDDIFDEAVIEKNNWLMYGSSKPNKEPYKITNILIANKNVFLPSFFPRLFAFLNDCGFILGGLGPSKTTPKIEKILKKRLLDAS